MTARTLVIGWDAADWSFVHQAVQQGHMPNLAGLLGTGHLATFEQPAPLLPSTLWATLMTGVDALTHQVFDELEPRHDGSGLRPVGSHVRTAPTLWELTKQAGCPTTVVGFPTSHPMAKVSGVGVSDVAFASPDALELTQAVCPVDFSQHLHRLVVRPDQITSDMVDPFFGSPQSPDSTNEALQTHRKQTLQACLAKAATWQAIATAALQHRTWQAGFVRVPGFQWFASAWQTMQTRPGTATNMGENEPAWQTFWATACQFQDMVLGRLLELAGESTNVLVVANHSLSLFDPAPTSRDCPPPRDSSMAMAQRRPQGFALLHAAEGASHALPAKMKPTDLAPVVLGLCDAPMPAHLKPSAQATNTWHWPTNGFLESTRQTDQTDTNGNTQSHLPNNDDPACMQLASLGFRPQADPQLEAAQRRLDRQRRHMHATACLVHGRLSQAFDMASALVKEAPHDASHGLLLARICLQNNQSEDFVACVQQMLGPHAQKGAPLPPHLAKDATAWLGLAMVQSVGGKRARAMAALHQASVLAPEADWFHHMLGRAWLGLEEHQSAVDALDRALALNPHHDAAWAAKGEALFALKRWEQAVKCLEQAVAICPENAKWHAGLGQACLACKQWQQANAAFEKALDLGWSNHTLLSGYADALLAMGDVAGSQQRQRQAALASVPKTPAFW